jgi:hypothetical protein
MGRGHEHARRERQRLPGLGEQRRHLRHDPREQEDEHRRRGGGHHERVGERGAQAGPRRGRRLGVLGEPDERRGEGAARFTGGDQIVHQRREDARALAERGRERHALPHPGVRVGERLGERAVLLLGDGRERLGDRDAGGDERRQRPEGSRERAHRHAAASGPRFLPQLGRVDAERPQALPGGAHALRLDHPASSAAGGVERAVGEDRHPTPRPA